MRLKEDSDLFGNSSIKEYRKLKCNECESMNNHTLNGEDYYCDVCNSKKFIGFPEYVCHSHNQHECIIENGRMNTLWCLDCPDFY